MSVMVIFIIGGMDQGKLVYAQEKFPKAEYWNAYEETVRKEMEAGEDPICCVERALSEKRSGDLVMISREMGCGLIPMDPFERDYREVNGRVNCLIAAKADLVIRVIAGLGQVLKDTRKGQGTGSIDAARGDKL